ncbi:hypothetical protein HDU84_001860 [Entophlyctis sp. JEL0112]|nr:hypothetical protein HDU84_001860 [Entophlyctis sp. JEL0112]
MKIISNLRVAIAISIASAAGGTSTVLSSATDDVLPAASGGIDSLSPSAPPSRPPPPSVPPPLPAAQSVKRAQAIPRRCGPNWAAANEFCFSTCMSDGDCSDLAQCWDGLLLVCSSSSSPENKNSDVHNGGTADGLDNSLLYHRDASKRDWSQDHNHFGEVDHPHQDYHSSGSHGGGTENHGDDRAGNWFHDNVPHSHNPHWPRSRRNMDGANTVLRDLPANADYNDDGNRWHDNTWSQHHGGVWWWYPSHTKRDVRPRR